MILVGRELDTTTTVMMILGFCHVWFQTVSFFPLLSVSFLYIAEYYSIYKEIDQASFWFFQVLLITPASQLLLQYPRQKFLTILLSLIVITPLDSLLNNHLFIFFFPPKSVIVSASLPTVLLPLLFVVCLIACYWIYCGEGTCNKTATYKHVCECNPGYSNLLNITHFPCYRQCKNSNSKF